MCMLCLDTSLKAIHNVIILARWVSNNVYAMFRYKFESNSQRMRRTSAMMFQCVCYV